MGRDYRHKEDMDELSDMEKYFAMSWGTPKGLATLLFSLAFFLLAIGVFLWLLHVAGLVG
jgi:hypothetical protein